MNQRPESWKMAVWAAQNCGQSIISRLHNRKTSCPSGRVRPRYSQMRGFPDMRSVPLFDQRRLPSAIQMSLGILAVVLCLVNISGCAGGFQGYKPVAPTVSQPASITVPLGQTATFSVTATGTGTLAYQWFKNGVAISGANGSSYTTPPTLAGDSGAVFTVSVSNSAGTVTSGPATLTVQLPPPVAKSIVPSSATPPYNSSVLLVPTFSGGTAVIGSGGVGSSDISTSATSGSSYPTPLLTAPTTYTLTVTDPKGNVVSTTCLVSPMQISITPISPANQTLAPGQIPFTATASGGVTNNLIWSASGGTFTANVWTSPTTPGTYTITATSVEESSVFVTTTIVISAPVISAQPSSEHICSGSTLTLSVSASYATSYQWSLNGAPIPGATADLHRYARFVSGRRYLLCHRHKWRWQRHLQCCSDCRGFFHHFESDKPFASSHADRFLRRGRTGRWATFLPMVQIPPGGTTGTAIAGATSTNYATPPVDLSYDGAQYYATVTDSCGTLTSSDASLAVAAGNVPPTIITQPVGQSVAAGGTTSFIVTASGTPALSYQWYRIPAGQKVGAAIAGATSATYDVPATATATTNDQDSYYVIVTNAYGQATSQPAPLAVGNGILLQITGQPVTQYVDDGASATYQVTAECRFL